MNITFYGETRKNFNDSSNEPAVPTLGNFKIKELLLTEKWQEKSIVTVSFNASNTWLQNNLFPGRNPSRAEIAYRRARYFNFRKNDNTLVTFVLTNFEAEDLGNETSDITVEGADPRIFFEIMSSSPYASGESMISTRFNIASLLTAKVSNVSVDGMEAWQKLPLSRLNSNYSPTTEERRIGISTTDESFTGGNIEVAYPDPLPVKEAVDDLYGEMPQVELYPIDKFGRDGTNSPWWEWVPRTKTMTSLFFSENSGDMKINKYSGTWLETETMAYSSNDNQKFSFASGMSASRAGLRGPWAGIKTESFTPPENVNVNNFLRTKATTGTMQNSRLVIDCTLNFDKKDSKPFCGMIVNVRIGENIYYADVTELISHYSNEKGWEVNSPIFVDMDSVDLTDPIDSEKAIIFAFSGYSNYSIPTRSLTNDYYNWRVFVDGKMYGVFSGTSSSTGEINLYVGDTSEKIITIIPADGKYSAGWGRAWSYGTSRGSDSREGYHLRKVINDPDWAHVLSETETGDYFRAYQFRGCSNLTEPVPEAMPNTVKKIGDYAFYYQYRGCYNLQYPAVEYYSENVEGYVGTHFRAYQYYYSTGFLSAAEFFHSDKVTEYGDNFRYGQYRMNDYSTHAGITSAPNEPSWSSLVTINKSFMGYVFANSKIVTQPEEGDISVSKVGDGFRAGMFSECRDLVNSKNEKSTGASIIGIGYRAYQFNNCKSLTTPGDEALSSVVDLGEDFRKNQYYGSGVTKTSPEVLSGNLNEIKEGFRENQYSYSSVSEITSKEILPSTVKRIHPRYRYGQFSICYNLLRNQEEADYNNIEELVIRSSYYEENYFKYGQYRYCPSLSFIHPESDWNSLNDSPTVSGYGIGEHFREYQYSDIGQAIAPDEGAMPLITNPGNRFRYGQYEGAKIIEIGKEASMPKVTSLMRDYRSSQYENCPNITNNKRLMEGEIALEDVSVGNYYRYSQFKNSGIIYALKERNVLLSSGQNYRSSMYENCVNLIEIYPEGEIFDFISYSRANNYRSKQFKNAVNLNPTNKNVIYKYSNKITGTYRIEMFAGTPYSNTPGDRINYIDGSEVIEGQNNIPADFYTD